MRIEGKGNSAQQKTEKIQNEKSWVSLLLVEPPLIPQQMLNGADWHLSRWTNNGPTVFSRLPMDTTPEQPINGFSGGQPFPSQGSDECLKSHHAPPLLTYTTPVSSCGRIRDHIRENDLENTG